jgi:hypothetical protein
MAVGTKIGRERGYQNAIECSTRGPGTLITFGNVGVLVCNVRALEDRGAVG